VRTRGLLVSLAAMSLLVAPVFPGQDAKDKDKEAAKEKAKAKPPARSYSDDDLKKYKDQPKDKPKDEGAGAQAGSAGESGAAAEPAPRQRRSREYGGYQELPPEPPPTAPVPPTRAQERTPEPVTPEPAEDTRSSEEVEWKRRAVQARRPVEAVQGQIAQIDSEMAGLKDQLNPMSTSYVLGGNSTAGAGAVLEIEEKLRNLENRRAGAKAELAEAEKGWQGFLEEARAAGANPAWFTP
jgi:hypothetical protein